MNNDFFYIICYNEYESRDKVENRKGFTLVELLAMLVVLGVLMGVTIPNITGILGNNRLNVIKTDALEMVDKAKIKVARGDITERPKNNHCIVFTLDYLNDNGDITTGPNGGVYDQYESFIIYKRQGNRYKYYVRLIEDADERTGFNFEDIDNINEVKNNNIKKITKEIGLTKVSSESIDMLNADSEVQAKCPYGVDEYFATRRPD